MAYKSKTEILWYLYGERAVGTHNSNLPEGSANRPLEELYDNIDFVSNDLSINFYTKPEVDGLIATGSLDPTLFYTRTELGITGGSSVHWGNITNVPTGSTYTHNSLPDLQGGAVNDYFHITQLEKLQLTSNINADSLHLHNHSGLQGVLGGENHLTYDEKTDLLSLISGGGGGSSITASLKSLKQSNILNCYILKLIDSTGGVTTQGCDMSIWGSSTQPLVEFNRGDENPQISFINLKIFISDSEAFTESPTNMDIALRGTYKEFQIIFGEQYKTGSELEFLHTETPVDITTGDPSISSIILSFTQSSPSSLILNGILPTFNTNSSFKSCRLSISIECISHSEDENELLEIINLTT